MTEEQKAIQSELEPKPQPEPGPQPEPTPERSIETPSEPSFARRALRWVFRMLMTVLFGVALGAGIYFGARSLYRDAIEPLQTLDQRMIDVEASMSDLSESVREDKDNTDDVITDLQGRIALQAEELASISAQLSRLELQAEDQAEALDEIAELRQSVDQVEQDLASTDENLEKLEGLIEAGELPAERVQQTLQLIRVMNLITRARLWIEENNYGLASDDTKDALEIMQSISAVEESGQEQDNQLMEITERLTVALEATRNNPALAEEELEVVWKLLIEATEPEGFANTPDEEG